MKNEDIAIESLIKIVRGRQVLLDRDLAALYDVETKYLNRQVKRNADRFPEDFLFHLSKEECLRCQIVTLNEGRGQHSKYLPYAFTENGIAMLSGVLRSPTAVEVNIRIMRAFNSMRHFIAGNAVLFNRLEAVEQSQIEVVRTQSELLVHQKETDKRIDEVFRRLEDGSPQISQGIFYSGQVYDAYSFVSNLIRSARNSILLIDNYADDSVLTLLDKRNAGVAATIYTSHIDKQLGLDISKHNAQYPPIEVKTFRHSHDRFMCIDNDVYHIGASIKDLGKKWFAFSKMEILSSTEIISRINSET